MTVGFAHFHPTRGSVAALVSLGVDGLRGPVIALPIRAIRIFRSHGALAWQVRMRRSADLGSEPCRLPDAARPEGGVLCVAGSRMPKRGKTRIFNRQPAFHMGSEGNWQGMEPGVNPAKGRQIKEA
jgi:hypothetical protein